MRLRAIIRALSKVGDDANVRSWDAVFAARDFAHGRINEKELKAAWSIATIAPARSAARSAAAWDTASNAAWAAWDAAWSATWDDERDWQNQRFFQYLTHGKDAENMECDG
jgi:hypothetical protein